MSICNEIGNIHIHFCTGLRLGKIQQQSKGKRPITEIIFAQVGNIHTLICTVGGVMRNSIAIWGLESDYGKYLYKNGQYPYSFLDCGWGWAKFSSNLRVKVWLRKMFVLKWAISIHLFAQWVGFGEILYTSRNWCLLIYPNGTYCITGQTHPVLCESNPFLHLDHSCRMCLYQKYQKVYMLYVSQWQETIPISVSGGLKPIETPYQCLKQETQNCTLVCIRRYIKHTLGCIKRAEFHTNVCVRRNINLFPACIRRYINHNLPVSRGPNFIIWEYHQNCYQKFRTIVTYITYVILKNTKHFNISMGEYHNPVYTRRDKSV